MDVDEIPILWHSEWMATVLVDTHKIVAGLKEHGFNDRQAEGITEVFRQIDLDHIVSRGDLKYELRDLELRLTLKMGTFAGAAMAFLAFLKFFS